MARDWRDGFAEFFGQGSDDQIQGGRSLKPGSKGIVDKNIWDDVWGRSQSELNNSQKTFTDDVLEGQYKAPIEALKGTYTRGGSEGSYIQQKRSLTRKDDNSAYTDSPTGKREIFNQNQQTDLLKNQNSLAQATLKQTGDLAANQMEMARLDNSFDRESASADRNLTLRLGEMNAELADKRLAYDRETRSMDKRDRMIATLMSGLGSLGGAFSL